MDQTFPVYVMCHNKCPQLYGFQMTVLTTARMQRSRKLSHSGYKIPELYVELESSLLARDLERACGLAAELSCTAGGQTRSVISFLLDTYCTRCINSGRAQMNLLHSALAHLGDGTPRSPSVKACHDSVFRRGLCSLTLLVACSRLDDRSAEAAFARVPRSEHVPSLESALEALRKTTIARDAHSMSAVIRAAPDEPWFKDPGHRGAQGLPDVLRLRAPSRNDAVWDLWRLACELAKDVGVSEYVENCLHAFAWGYSSLTARNRIHLLWYAYLVIVKGAPRTGPHPIDLPTFERALLSIDSVFSVPLSLSAPPSPSPSIPTQQCAEDLRMGYLSAVTKHDSCKAWEVEKDRTEVRSKSSDIRTVSLNQRRLMTVERDAC